MADYLKLTREEAILFITINDSCERVPPEIKRAAVTFIKKSAYIHDNKSKIQIILTHSVAGVPQIMLILHDENIKKGIIFTSGFSVWCQVNIGDVIFKTPAVDRFWIRQTDLFLNLFVNEIKAEEIVSLGVPSE